MTYEIIYDYSDEFFDDFNIGTTFTGTWDELQNYIEQLRDAGCYNFSVACISEEG